MTEKQEIRRKIKNLKALLDEADKLLAAEKAFARLERLAHFTLAKNILLYHSLPDELSTHSFLKKWHGKKRFFLPRVNGVNLEILPYDESKLELGSFHIEEPTGAEPADPSVLDLIIAPGVAFDTKRNRLGRGKGFYDRLLSTTKASKIGVAYHFQIVDEVPVDDHDIPMDIVITDEAIYIK